MKNKNNPIQLVRGNKYAAMPVETFAHIHAAAQLDAQVYADPLFTDYHNLNKEDNPLSVFNGLSFQLPNGDSFTVADKLTIKQLHQIARNDQTKQFVENVKRRIKVNVNINGTVKSNLKNSYGRKDKRFYHAILCARFLVGQSFIMAKTEHKSIGGFKSEPTAMEKSRPCYVIDLAGPQLQTLENDAMVGCVFNGRVSTLAPTIPSCLCRSGLSSPRWGAKANA